MLLERTPDGHPRIWLLYTPEPFAFESDDDARIHQWIRRCSAFVSRDAAIMHLATILGSTVRWRPYHELFPELWIGTDTRGRRWLMEPAPVLGGER